MRKFLIILSFIMIGVPNLSFAGDWSKEQKEVWNTITKWWDNFAANDIKGQRALLHDNMYSWRMDGPAPQNKEETLLWINENMKDNNDPIQTVTPMKVVVHGSTGVAHYVVQRARTDRNGKRVSETHRWTDIVIKDGGKWRFIAWQGATKVNK